jgi:2Fe-2S ferredoxin
LKYKKLERVKVVIKNLRMQEILLSETEKTLLFSLGAEGVDWMQACGRKGRCTTCLFQVHEGAENLSPPTDAELRYLAAGRLRNGQRLACQALVLGPVLISVPEYGRLPHIDYSEQ